MSTLSWIFDPWKIGLVWGTLIFLILLALYLGAILLTKDDQ
jgi:hypothetical protein